MIGCNAVGIGANTAVLGNDSITTTVLKECGIGTVLTRSETPHKTSTGTNSEIDIQSGSANKWGIYQDESTADLRFWNTDNRLTIYR